MRIIDAAKVTGAAAWDALDLVGPGVLDPATVRLHWTDRPYVWHVNDGVEVFVVLDGAVDMHHRVAGREEVVRLVAGRVCVVEPGDEHVAHPAPEARVLVVERAGSV
ncbi:cupin [Marmoricola endophyticus]|uniref:Cupin n=1 Tax=Marmoricola endophyticus TaxID=2040280 RepID=A0A917BCZ9_9ACTN|nr:cupin [Marmoricola endophyticus]GGF32757.1 cupin [Marmoricola endophyticus]